MGKNTVIKFLYMQNANIYWTDSTNLHDLRNADDFNFIKNQTMYGNDNRSMNLNKSEIYKTVRWIVRDV